MTVEDGEPRGLVIVGPTGVGKTRLSLAIAERMAAEIVSADSRQVYRYMDIGTCKPSPGERSRTVHHLIDVVDPDEEYDAGTYARQARQAVMGIVGRGMVPLIVGGSGLYVRALLYGFFEPEIRDAAVRRALKARVAREGSLSLFAELERVDPQTAQRVHPHDAQRIVRALEVFEATGRRLSAWQEFPPRPLGVKMLVLGLLRPREELYARIEARVDGMMGAGLLGEVEGLVARGYTAQLNALQTVGYREMLAHLEGEYDLAEAVRLIKRNSRRYAKRQMTWFGRDPGIRWLSGSADEVEALAERCLELLVGGESEPADENAKFSVDRAL